MSKIIKLFFKLFIVSSIWIAGFLCIFLFYKYNTLPNIDDINLNKNDQIIQINYSDNSKIRTIGNLYDNQITYDQLPNQLIAALIATEDRRFFSHNGFDIKGIIRAFLVNYKAGYRKQGASTITQQLAKILFLNNKKTINRKINEILLAHKLEKIFSKEQILTLYLNYAYFGAGNYGIKDAAKFYFGKKVSDLNLNESAILVGILKAPSKLAPHKHKKLAEDRADIVIKNMINDNKLGIDAIKDLDDNVNYKTDNLQRYYFTDYVAKNYQYFLNQQQKDGNFIRITTSLDPKIQDIAEDSVDRLYRKYPKRLQKSQIASLIMSYDGQILSMIGGKNYRASQFNRAIDSKRQIGSIFKTFIYLTAFENGFSPDDIVTDQQIAIANWQPKNYNNKYYGDVSLRRAFAKSLNSVAVGLTQKLGIKKIIKNVQKLNIESPIPNNLTIALGTAELTLLEAATAFTIIANGGNYIMPSFIQKIESESRKIFYQRQTSNIGKIFDNQDILAIKDLLREVVANGTGKNADISEDIYGKTGTTQNFKDAYFIGFNSKYIIAIWIGNDDNKATNKITGGMLPALLFRDIIANLIEF